MKLPMAGDNSDNPSMEDILNTIRGVIAGDESDIKNLSQGTKDSQKKPSSNSSQTSRQQSGIMPPNTVDEDDVLELTDIVEEGTPMQNKYEDPLVEDDSLASEDLLDDIDNMLDQDNIDNEDENTKSLEEIDEPASQNTPSKTSKTPVQETEQPQHMRESSVTKPETNDAPSSKRLVSETTAAASQAILKEMIASVPRQRIDSLEFRSGTTLENLVIETMRPFLADWLEKNLPTIVKQLVEKEIKHLIPRDVE
jgi:cell pole-organizing protein PopZ